MESPLEPTTIALSVNEESLDPETGEGGSPAGTQTQAAAKQKKPQKARPDVMKWILGCLKKEGPQSETGLINTALEKKSKPKCFTDLKKDATKGFTSRIRVALTELVTQGTIKNDNHKFSLDASTETKTKEGKSKKSKKSKEGKSKKRENESKEEIVDAPQPLVKKLKSSKEEEVKGGEWHIFKKGLHMKGEKIVKISPKFTTNRTCCALVIGNSNYDSNRALEGAFHDALDVTTVLIELGFEITLILNGTGEDESKFLNEFFDQSASKPTICFFYYAGHGFTRRSDPARLDNNNNETVFVAVDHSEVDFKPLPLGKRPISFISVIDACRVLRDRSNQSWVAPQFKQRGYVTVFATSEGFVSTETQANGAYTAELVKHLADDCSIFDMFQKVATDFCGNNQQNGNPPQVPNLNTTLLGEMLNLAKLRTHPTK